MDMRCWHEMLTWDVDMRCWLKFKSTSNVDLSVFRSSSSFVGKILQMGPFRLKRSFCAKMKILTLKMCKQQFLRIPSKTQKASIAHHPERGPLVLSAFHCWILNNVLEWFNLPCLFILHSCLPVGLRSQIHSHSIISCFPSCWFCEDEPSPVVSLWTWACFARSATDLLLVGNWTRAPDSFQLSQPRASPQLRQRRLRQKAPSLSSATLALTKMWLFPESPSPHLLWGQYCPTQASWCAFMQSNRTTAESLTGDHSTSLWLADPLLSSFL